LKKAPALVHEAYLRLVGDQKFQGRAHFFADVAEAMRRILIEAARRRQLPKHGGGRRRIELDEAHRVRIAQASRAIIGQAKIVILSS
jgi:hypothetical protein